MKRTLQGVLPVLHTPYNADFSIDWGALSAQVEFVFASGAQGITFALASEMLRLTSEERRAMAEFLGRDQAGEVVISVGAESTFAAVDFARHAQRSGATALMAIPPLSCAAGEEQLRAYYCGILESTEIPLVVQDASGYVGSPLSTEFQLNLWGEWGDRVAFKPESAPVGPVISALSEAGATVLEGSGGSLLVENYRRGLSGTMPGADLCPAIIALWRSLAKGDEAQIYRIGPLVGAILAMAANLDGFLAIEKHLMHRRGLFSNRLVRGPVAFELDGPMRAEIDRLFDKLQEATT